MCRPAFHALLIIGALGCDDRRADGLAEIAVDSIVLFELDSGTVGYRDLAIGRGGEVWALAETAPFVQRYSSDGRLVQRFGRRGTGPGELRNPISLVPTSDSERPIRIYEPAARSIIDFGQDGQEVGRHDVMLATAPVVGDVRRLSYGRPRHLIAAGEHVLAWDQPEGVARTDDLRQSVLVRLDSAGMPADTLRDLRATEPDNEVLVVSAYLVPVPLVAPCPDGTVLLLQPSRNLLERLSPDGGVLASDTIALPARQLTEGERRTRPRSSA